MSLQLTVVFDVVFLWSWWWALYNWFAHHRVNLWKNSLLEEKNAWKYSAVHFCFFQSLIQQLHINTKRQDCGTVSTCCAHFLKPAEHLEMAIVSSVKPTFFHYYYDRFFFSFPNTCDKNSSQSFKRFSDSRWAFHANNGSILVLLEEKQQICLESEGEDRTLVPFSPLCRQYMCLSLSSLLELVSSSSSSRYPGGFFVKCAQIRAHSSGCRCTYIISVFW